MSEKGYSACLEPGRDARNSIEELDLEGYCFVRSDEDPHLD